MPAKQKIQFRRGLKVNIPTLDIGEVGFCTDTFELAVGSSGGNKYFPAGPSLFLDIHGSAAAPVSIDPTVGIVPSAYQNQVWWIKPNAGSGNVPVTANPAIAPGFIGQKITLKSPPAANYLSIPNGAGTEQNDVVDFGPFGQSATWTFDGANWSEDGRRV